MVRIDSDTHVDETEASWEYLEGKEKTYQPICLDPGTINESDGLPHRLWLIDGQVYRRPFREDGATGTTVATRELLDVDERLRHMDELRVDVHVIYPTVHINLRPMRPQVEIAMRKSYNRWIADRTKDSHGRLRWIAMLPVSSMDKALEELRWAKDHGAVGIFKKPFECDGRSASDPYFFPLYEEAQRLDVPICIHTSSEGSRVQGALALGLVAACDALVTARVPEKFPGLRVGFLEGTAAWIPFLMSLFGTRIRPHEDGTSRGFELVPDVFRAYRLYVACQATDDLPDLLKYGTEDNLLVGSDYTHHDNSHDLSALDVIEQRAAAGTISAEAGRKILDENPRRFYGI